MNSPTHAETAAEWLTRYRAGEQKKLFDCRCLELAVHFLSDDEMFKAMSTEDKQDQVDDLAAWIQSAVEDWFYDR